MHFQDRETQIQITESKAVKVKIFMLQELNEVEEVLEEVENPVTLLAWATEMQEYQRWSNQWTKLEATLVRQKQYPIRWEARKG